ncbi:SAM-dependent methyltransferase [Buchnera aphidicola]|uniref:SAM-dependent methyltransferase n=1 Tax=Buchnera aphidicola TaxID=9 RepID=UPI0031B876A8
MKYRKFSKSSKIWLNRNSKNQYVLMTKKKNLISRSWFKIHEINVRNNIFKKNMNIVDLGSSPGGWSKYVSKYINNKGKLISCDIKKMKFLKNIMFYKGNLFNKKFLEYFLRQINKNRIDVLMSDMSPNISGHSCVDINNSIKLLELSFYICKNIFFKKGIYIVKAFDGKGLNEFIKILKNFFISVKINKLKSSYKNSKELFIIGRGIK